MWEKAAYALGGAAVAVAAVLGAEYLASGPKRDRSKDSSRRRKARRAAKAAVKMLTAAVKAGKTKAAHKPAIAKKAANLVAALQANGTQVTVKP